MDDSKRIIIAFVLVFIILFVYNQVFYKPPPKKVSEPQPEKPVQEKVEEIVEPAPVEEKEMFEYEELVLTFENDNYRAEVTNRGGGVRSLYLKRYRAELMPGINFTSAVDGQDLTNEQFDIKKVADTIICRRDNIEKRYVFNTYGFLMLSSVLGKKQDLRFSRGLAVTEFKNRGDDLKRFACYVKTEGLKKLKVKEAKRYIVNPAWIGLRTKYFFMPVEPRRPIESFTLWKRDDKRYGLTITTSSQAELNVRFLPIDYWFLAGFKREFEGISTGGIFGPIGRLILQFFRLLYPLVKNFGLVIVLFSLMVKLILHPLNRQQLEMQRKMQLLQPEMEKLGKKYKDDPQALNKEMMDLYKSFGLNPAGCFLPLIVQLPLFMALYNMLLTAIDFRQAAFIFWIRDLSIKDPYYVLPIVMGAMFLIQSLITSTDPRNRMMSIFMPVFFTFIFLNFPSGLQLYWLSFNLFSIIESLWYRKRSGGRR